MDFLDRIFLRIFGIHLHRASIGARALTRSANFTRVTLLPAGAAILNCDDDSRVFGVVDVSWPP